MRRILALVLSVVMVLMLPVFAFADGYWVGSTWVETDTTDSSSEVTDSEGNVTKTTTTADGTIETVVTPAEGEQTVDVDLSKAAAEEVYLTNAEVTATEDVATAPKVTVELPAGTESAKVEIAVANNGARVTLMQKNADGTWKVVKQTAVGNDGIVVEVKDAEATYAVVVNDKEFTDITSDWQMEAADFVSSRELMLGTGENTFNPAGEITADMMMTVLARLDDGVTTEQSTGSNWAAAGEAWAASEGYTVSGTFTRADMAKLLYKYAGSPESDASALAKFADVEGLDADTTAALAWCAQKGILGGTGETTMSPDGTATRAQLAAVMMRYIKTLVND